MSFRYSHSGLKSNAVILKQGIPCLSCLFFLLLYFCFVFVKLYFYNDVAMCELVVTIFHLR